MILPKQLQDKRLRFVKIQAGRKKPFEEGWQEYNNYKYDESEFQEYLKDAKSYGILCTNGLAILDIDVKTKDKSLLNKILIEGKLPSTFTTKTGSGGFHFYFWIPDLDKKIVLNKKGKHYGELQAVNAQCLGPGSLHPTGTKYEIYNDSEIKQIKFNEIDSVISDYYEKKDTDKFETINSGLQWDISKLIDKCNDNLIKQGKPPLETKDGVIYRGGHPVEAHGSETGHNFEIDIEKGVWHCYRCERGGDAITLVAMLEGMTDKGMCPGKGFFSNSKNKNMFLQIKKIAIDNYGFPDDGYKAFDIQLFTESDKNKRIMNENVYNYLKDHNCKFITIRDETGRQPHIYFYKDGYYKLNGEDFIVQILQELFYNKQNITWQRKYKLEILDYLKTQEIKNRKDILPPKDFINFNNGVYNIKTKKLMSHNPKYYFLYKIPWDYSKKHKKLKPQVEKFFESTFKNNRDYIAFTQELFGYCLYSGYDIHGLFYLYGTGGNGKSVWLSLLEYMLGEDNVTNKSVDSLMAYRFTTSALYGKLLNYCGELTDSVMQRTDMLKRLTSGDKIQAEFKGKDGFDFRNIAKIITACNFIPPCYDRTDGWYERQYILPFLQKFRDTKKCDLDLLEKLKTKENMESLIYWSVEGLHRLLRNKKFTYGDKKITYLMYQGNAKYYVKIHYARSDNISDFVKVDEVREDYCKWCNKNNIPVESDEALDSAFRYYKYPETVLMSESKKKIYVRYGLKKVM